MTDLLAPETPVFWHEEDGLASVSYDWLDAGVVLATSPAPTMVATGITFSSVAVSTAELIIAGQRVAAGRSVQGLIEGGMAGGVYTIKVTAYTDTSPQQRRVIFCRLAVIADEGDL